VAGTDTILLPALTLLATGPFNPGAVGLTATPSVTSTIIISGGVGGAIVERSGAAQYRLFHVGSSGNLTLEQVTVRYGNSASVGGAIYNGGVLTLLDSDIFSNTAFNGGTGLTCLDKTQFARRRCGKALSAVVVMSQNHPIAGLISMSMFAQVKTLHRDPL
jgi:hypothetical protein